jgi:hypothetical protein
MLIAVTVLAGQTGCYTTKIVTDKRPSTRAYQAEDRQWFTIGGLVPLSGPAGRECEHGLSYAESSMSGVDILINIGVGVAGALIGSAACSESDEQARFSCASTGATFLPFLLGSRTVTYACAAGPSARDMNKLVPSAPEAPLPPPPPAAAPPAAAPPEPPPAPTP